MIVIYAKDSTGAGYGPWAYTATMTKRTVDILTNDAGLALTECVWVVPGTLDLGA